MKNQTSNQSFFSSSTWVLIFIIFVILSVRIVSEFADSSGKVNNASNAGLPEDLDYSEVEDLYDELRSKYNGEISEADLIDGLKSGLVDGAGDRYTTYLNPSAYNELEQSLNETFSGIGAELGVEDDFVIIVAPIDGLPAEAAGIRSGDRIIAVDGESVVGETIEKVVALIRGESGTDVEITMRRVNETIDFTVTRQNIDLPSVVWEVQDGNIGYLRISSFADDTADLAEDAITEFNGAGINKLIVDVRNNGGGILNETVDLAGLWLDKKVVVRQDSKLDYVAESYKSSGGAIVGGDTETVVLINGGSASASEILAVALQDHGAATVVGETSFGKGTVQEVASLDDDGYLKVTIAEWLSPNGSKIDEVGVTPDIASEFDLESEDDSQLQDAINFLNK